MICKYYKDGIKLNVADLNEITVLIDRSETELTEAALNSWWPGLDGPPHRHEQKEQIFYVISGRGLVKIGGETFDAAPGAFFYVPAGVIHQTINQGSDRLEYFLFNAFLNADKEGHASFADHIDKVKETRRQQAQTQSADAGSRSPNADFSRQGKCIPKVALECGKDSASAAKVLLLDRVETQRCETFLLSWPAGQTSVPTASAEKEQTLFILTGSGSVTVGKETVPVKAGHVIFVPRNTLFAMQSAAETMRCISFGTVISE